MREVSDALNARIGDLEWKLAIADALAATRAAALLRAEMRVLDRNARIAELEAVLRTMIDSAHPHPVEHPTMTAAWAVARKALEGAERLEMKRKSDKEGASGG